MATADSGRSTPRTAVITVSYHSERVLPDFLNSVVDATSEPVELVVVDNDPTVDSSVSALVEKADATYLPLEGNRGYGGAINEAVRSLETHVQWLVISNPDVVLGPQAIGRLIDRAREDDSIGSVGPLILDSSGTPYPSARAIPSLRTGVGHALFANIWSSNPWTREYRAENIDEALAPRDAGWLSGACLVIRRSAFEAVGGFDERFFMYFEDVDLGFRLGRAGFRNVYEPTAIIVHTGAHSTAKHSSRMVAAHHVSADLFLRKRYPGALHWPLRMALSISLRVRSQLTRKRARLG